LKIIWENLLMLRQLLRSWEPVKCTINACLTFTQGEKVLALLLQDVMLLAITHTKQPLIHMDPYFAQLINIPHKKILCKTIFSYKILISNTYPLKQGFDTSGIYIPRRKMPRPLSSLASILKRVGCLRIRDNTACIIFFLCSR
jgi:hypothetical protein